MRSFFLPCAGLLGLLSLVSSFGCSKEVKAEFPRPPATASMPPPEEPKPSPEPPVVIVIEPEPPAEPDDDEAEPETDEAPAPEPQPKPAPPEPVVEPPLEPASPQLAERGAIDPVVLEKLERAGSLLSSVGARHLSEGQRQQFTAARGFVSQARRALDEGDERRALVLIDKGLILAEDIERSSRP